MGFHDKHDVPTPRTDAAKFEILSSLQSGTDSVVHADFARQLERELAERRSQCDHVERENETLREVMVAAAEELAAHWEAHCDAEGYGPVNLERRLNECLAVSYPGYSMGEFARMQRELAEKTDRLNAALTRLKGLHGLRLEGEPKPIDNSRFFKEQKSEAPQAESSDVPVVESGHGAARRPAVASPHSSEKDRAVMPLEPTAAMIEEGAQRLVRLETGEEVWPDSWDWLQVRAARQEAERVWRSMWLAASDTSSATPYQLPWTPEETARRFHEAYEHFAPAFGYKTRSDTREWNSDSANGRLMIAVIRNVLIEQVVCE